MCAFKISSPFTNEVTGFASLGNVHELELESIPSLRDEDLLSLGTVHKCESSHQ